MNRLRRDFRRLRTIKGWSVPRALFDAVFLDSGFQAVFLHRMAHSLLRWRIPVLPALCRRISIGSCGVDILPHARIGGGLFIPHSPGIVIGGRTVIGEDCTLLHGVTLGEARFDELDCPRLGNRVTVGAGAQVLGGITVGDNALIGAGSVVLAPVPAGAVVAGVPARPLRRRRDALEDTAPDLPRPVLDDTADDLPRPAAHDDGTGGDSHDPPPEAPPEWDPDPRPPRPSWLRSSRSASSLRAAPRRRPRLCSRAPAIPTR